MNSAGLHAFAIALIFFVAALGLGTYALWKPQSRPDLVRLGVWRCLMCAAAFSVSGYAKIVEPESLRVQILTLAPVNFTIILAISGICAYQARSYGTVDISPKARQLLRHSKRMFIFTFVLSMALTLIWPVAAQEDFEPAPKIYLLDRALVSFPEVFFSAVAAFVSFQATRTHEPANRIRMQQAAMFLSHVFLVLLCANTYIPVCARVFVENEAVRRTIIEASHVRDGVLLALTVTAYLVGICLYYVSDERSRLTTQFAKWRRQRGTWESRLRRLDDKSLEEQYPEYGNIKDAVPELVQRGLEEGTVNGSVSENTRKAQLAFKILTIVTSHGFRINKENDAELLKLIKYHDRLLRESATEAMCWQITNESEGARKFDLRRDTLLEVARELRTFVHDSTNRVGLVSKPEWFQVAVLTAAHAGLITGERATRITKGNVVMDRVCRAYHNATLIRSMYDNVDPPEKTETLRNTALSRYNI